MANTVACLILTVVLTSIAVSQNHHGGCDHHRATHPAARTSLRRSQFSSQHRQWDERRSNYHFGDRRSSPSRFSSELSSRASSQQFLPSHPGFSNRASSRQSLNNSPVEPVFWGCYSDDSDGMLKGWWFGHANMTLEVCWDECERRQFRFAGLENSTDCFCGNTFDRFRYIKRPIRQCNLQCGGNSSQLCGGEWRLSLYEIQYL